MDNKKSSRIGTQGLSRRRRALKQGMDKVFTIFVNNLPVQMNRKWLSELFGRYGRVLDAHIPLKRGKSGHKFGFVRYNSKKAVERASSLMNGRRVLGYRLSVELARYSGTSYVWRKEKCHVDIVNHVGNMFQVGGRWFYWRKELNDQSMQKVSVTVPSTTTTSEHTTMLVDASTQTPLKGKRLRLQEVSDYDLEQRQIIRRCLQAEKIKPTLISFKRKWVEDASEVIITVRQVRQCLPSHLVAQMEPNQNGNFNLKERKSIALETQSNVLQDDGNIHPETRRGLIEENDPGEDTFHDANTTISELDDVAVIATLEEEAYPLLATITTPLAPPLVQFSEMVATIPLLTLATLGIPKVTTPTNAILPIKQVLVMGGAQSDGLRQVGPYQPPMES